ncbi:hypothetical protein ACGFYQ_34300 [Streptomyces sp. NPDC048258]|uniref:hypothetical protein n=1 Tax=Streptomyces sp. NPDC048258 TaxID=3365527 RepID=UPI003717A0C4
MPGIIAPQRDRKSRTPTRLPNPPMVLLTGEWKTGKSYEAARGSGSDLVGMTYWIQIGGGEGTADYYGDVPGARYEIVPHDGSYQDILDAIRWAIAQDPANGKQNMIVLDSVTSLWDLLSDEVALLARHRAVRRAQESGRRARQFDAVVSDEDERDLWNRAKDRWGEVLWLLRRHSGPTLFIARQELVTAFENNKPTRHTYRRIRAEKNLGAAVDAIVELHAPGEAYVTGARTLHWQITPGETAERFEDFSVDALLRRLGYENAAPVRSATELAPAAYLQEQQVPPAEQPRKAPVQVQRAAEPELTGRQAEDLIRKALMDENNPEEALLNVREYWGIRTLEKTTTNGRWGRMSAQDLVTRSLAYAKEREKKKAEQDQASTTTPDGERQPPATAQSSHTDANTAPGASPEIEKGQQEGPEEEESTPPPPDPEFDEAPGEDPEAVSEAEEPQDRPTAPPTARRLSKGEKMALDAMMDEATIQARVRFLTVGEHLDPISEDGPPAMNKLRDYLQKHRPAVIAALVEADEQALADLYKRAPMPDLSIKKKFAAYFEQATISA